MIPTTTASLSLSLANGVLKLARQLDRLQAERAAVEGNLALPMPEVSALSRKEIERDLKALLAETAGQTPDPIGAEDRKTLAGMFGKAAAGDYMPFYDRLFPDRVLRRIQPDSEFVQRLDELGIDDEQARLAAFYINAGQDDRRMSYAWRLGLTVADALSELGAESTSLFIRDEKLQQVAQAVLTRFAETDLEKIGAWKGLLRHALQATLNGALDARESLEAGPEWVESVLGALAGARDKVEALHPGQADNFIAGLVRGKGYRLLIGAALETAAGKLGGEGASAFEEIAVDFLTAAAPLVEADKNGFKDFFQDHWGDLLRAGFTSLEAHGPALLEGSSPVLRQSLLAIVGRLAETPDNALLSRETLVSLVHSTLATVLSDSGVLDDLEPWLQELVASLTGVLAAEGVRGAFSREGVQELLRGALATLADHPELLAAKPGLVRDVVGEILERLSGVSGFALKELAQAAVEGALEAVSASPTLLDDEGGKAIAELAGLIAEQVKAKTLSKIQGSDLLRAALATLAENPELIAGKPGLLRDAVSSLLTRLEGVSSFGAQDLAQAAVESLLEAAATSPELLGKESGQAIAELAGLIADQVKAKTLTKIQGKDLLWALLAVLSDHPELITDEPGLLRDALAAIFSRLDDISGFDARELATHAVAALLEAIAADPRLLAKDATRVLADFAGFVAAEVRAKTLTKIQAADLLHGLVAALPKNPQLFLELESQLAQAVVKAIIGVAGRSPAGLLAGSQIVSLASGVLESFAARGSAVVKNQTLQALLAALGDLLEAGLARAAEELGQGFDLDGLSPLLMELVSAWLRGEVGVIDAADPAFAKLFAKLVSQLAA